MSKAAKRSKSTRMTQAFDLSPFLRDISGGFLFATSSPEREPQQYQEVDDITKDK